MSLAPVRAILQCIHVAGCGLCIGAIAIVDFRLLDLTPGHRTRTALLRDTGVWTLVGTVIAVASGFLLYSSGADLYFLNLYFDLKMTFLAMAVVFNYTTHRKAVLPSTSPNMSKVIAGLSLALWVSVLFCGLLTGFSVTAVRFKD